MNDAIARIYYRLVKAGKRTIEQVPANLREEIQKLLDADIPSVQSMLSENNQL